MVERNKLFDQLKKLSESKFEELLFLLDIDLSQIRGSGVTQSQRAIDLLKYLELEVNGLTRLEKTLDELALLKDVSVQINYYDLSSERNVDYTRLQNLLTEGKWKEADWETLTVILKVAGREKEGWLNIRSIEMFPHADLRTIDSLWVKYSDGRFGFSVQSRIWESVGGKSGEYDYEIYKEFGDRVGWRVEGKWQEYNEISYSLNAQPGHLPARGYWEVVRSEGSIKEGYKDVYYGSDFLGVGSGRHMLFSRVKTCK